jgi:hypothetical protein
MNCNNYFDMTDQGDSFETWQGLRGPYYIPHLTADGVLSWTNTGSLPNPAPVDISGPPGSSVELRGPVPSVEDLPATASSSELWLVGAASPYDGYFYNGVRWENAGQIAVGPVGPAGEDGVSPEIEIETITGGHTVTITDAEHPAGQSFDVMDGTDGAPGSPGTPGAPGAAAGFGTPTATVDTNVGTPSVEISASGPDTAKVFSFAFHNLKGEPGSGGGGPDPYTSDPADLAAAASPGSASQYSRGDHVHKLPTAAQIGAYVKPSGGIPASDLASGVIPSVPSASTATPAMDGTASPGSSGSWSRGDHVHPSDTGKQDKITASGILKGDGSGSVSAAVAGTDYLTPSTNYSQVNGVSANYSLVAADIGKTIRIAATSDVRITFTSALSSSMGNGAEIAFVKLTPNITATIDMSETGGCYGFVDGEAKTFSVFRLANAYELAAVKKIYGDANRWLVQGNVEVVS